MKKRLEPKERKAQILAAAVTLAKRDGYKCVTRDAVADHVGISMGLVSRYFGTMPQLRRDIMRFAVREEIPEIVAQGLVARDPHAQKAPDDLRARAVKYIAGL